MGKNVNIISSIESISEFSAIQGGIVSTMLFGAAVTTLTIVAWRIIIGQVISFILLGTLLLFYLGI